jgi:hypothetical protein
MLLVFEEHLALAMASALASALASTTNRIPQSQSAPTAAKLVRRVFVYNENNEEIPGRVRLDAHHTQPSR